jgi:uncharacterized protein
VRSAADEKLIQLQRKINDMKKVTIGFSGGVDSTFLLAVCAQILGRNTLAVTVNAPLFPVKEINEAKKLAASMNINHKFINLDITVIKAFTHNPPDRCYHCKKLIYSTIKEVANTHNISNVLDASNHDDKKDYRPGMKALQELNIQTPLIDVHLTKEEIRLLSKQMNLPTWSKPSFACLASRFPYKIPITESRLHQVEQAESILANLGLHQYRVRFHNEIARIEVEQTEFKKIFENKDKIVKSLKTLGFRYITLDLEGYRPGSLNEGL